MTETRPGTRIDYLKERLTLIGLTVPDITIRGRSGPSDVIGGEYQLLTSDESGNIVINYPTLQGDVSQYIKSGKARPYYRLRYAPKNVVDKKYHTPYGASAKVFLPPNLIGAYSRKEEIKTLFVVEGEFKALAGAKHGLFIAGLQGIQNYLQKSEDNKHKFLNAELGAIIRDCKVKNLVLLFDGDCLVVEYESEEKDLHKRLNSFYTAARGFREHTKHFNTDVYFSHIKPELKAKGLDDLFVEFPKDNKKIVADLCLLAQAKDYFACQNVTDKSLNKLLDYFNIRNEHAFYDAYQDIIEQKAFTFRGTKYQYNGNKLEVLCISEAKNLLRVGDEYFEKVNMPDKNGDTYPTTVRRRKGTILDDYKHRAPTILQMIKKYKGFCNVPNNVKYSEEVAGFFNLYQPMPIEPHAGEIEQTLKFVTHIFGEQVELGLDYLQLLYLQPTHILPILCLVSKEQETGKTTFAEWLRFLFGSNVTSVTSQDLEGQFNDNYATKLLIYVDETFIDKKQVKERIKNLSTAGSISRNAKNQAKEDIPFFGKFILCSNNETDFINIESSDVRFWVRKIERIQEKDPHFKALLEEEAPAFLWHLQNRQMHINKPKTRMWFDIADLQTEALRSAVAESKGYIYKSLCHLLREYFLTFQKKEIRLTNGDILIQLLSQGIKTTPHQLGKIIKDELNLDPEKFPASYELVNIHHPDSQPEAKRGRFYAFRSEQFLTETEEKEIIK